MSFLDPSFTVIWLSYKQNETVKDRSRQGDAEVQQMGNSAILGLTHNYFCQAAQQKQHRHCH